MDAHSAGSIGYYLCLSIPAQQKPILRWLLEVKKVLVGSLLLSTFN